MKKSCKIFLDILTKHHDNYSIEEEKYLIEQISTDLRCLLNSYPRMHFVNKKCILTYGISDLTQYLTYSESDKKKVQSLIHDCIIIFEKKLTDVQVQVFNNEKYISQFGFIIKAKISLEFKTIPITLESKISSTINQVIYIYI